MQPDTHETVADVLCKVLEELAFMFGDQAERDELDLEPEQALQATISFRGPTADGRVLLAVPQGMAPELARNVLGLDDDDPDIEEQAEDALKELLNVVCGQLLTAIAGDEPIFDLSVPEVRAIDRGQWDELADAPDTNGFLVDDEPVLCAFVYRS